jgi:hypothetical protein
MKGFLENERRTRRRDQSAIKNVGNQITFTSSNCSQQSSNGTHKKKTRKGQASLQDNGLVAPNTVIHGEDCACKLNDT